MKPGLLFVNFGGPTRDEELEPFLFNLLSDVLPGPKALASGLAGILAPRRAKKVRDTYREIGWSPLVSDSRAQAQAVVDALDDDVPFALGMMFSEPTMTVGLRELLGKGCDHIIVVGLFPHYSFATSASAYDMVHEALGQLGRRDVGVHYARTFFDDVRYHRSVAATIREAHDGMPGEGPVHLLFSAHGVPVSFVKNGDPYPDQIRASVRAVVEALQWDDPWHLGWQSRLGPVRWLEPTTPNTLDAIGKAGGQRVLVVPISFVGEHIETLDEIDREYREHAHHAGIPHFGRAAAVGLQPDFIGCMADLVREALGRFDRSTCVRCLVPVEPDHFKRKQCPSCSFVVPTYLREG